MFFCVCHYSKAMDAFYVDFDSHRSWLDVLKSVFEHIFFLNVADFLLQILQSLLNMPVLNIRL